MFAPGFGRYATRSAPAGTRKRRKRKTKTKKTANRRRRKSSRGAKFVKGSAAAKRHMAKLRRMQKRKR